MKNSLFFICIILFSSIFGSCSNDNVEFPSRTILSIYSDNVHDLFSTTLEFERFGGEKTFDLYSNKEWSITPNEGQSWCVIYPKLHDVAGDYIINIKVEPNETEEERIAKFTAKADTVERNITILQKPKAYLRLSMNEITFDEYGGDFSVDIESSVDYKVDFEDFWLSEFTGEKPFKQTRYFKVSPSSEDRTSKIYFLTDCYVNDTIIITQKPTLISSFYEYKLITDESICLDIENRSTKSLVWSSSAPELVTVSQEGVITAISKGEAIITAETTDHYSSLSYKIAVLDVEELVKITGGSGGYEIIASTSGSYAGYYNSFSIENELAGDIEIQEIKYFYKGNQIEKSTDKIVLEKGKSLNWQLRTNSKCYNFVNCQVLFKYAGRLYTVSN